MKKFAVFILMTVLSFFSMAAMANPPGEPVKPLLLQGLAKYQGRHLTVLYGIAKQPIVSVDDRQLDVHQIKHVVDAVAINGNTVALPGVVLPPNGFRPAYNYIVFIVHAQPRFVWSNADGKVPVDPRGINPSMEDLAAIYVQALSKQDLLSLDAAQGQPERVTVNF